MLFAGLGLAQTYVDAKRVVEALTRAQSDPSYYESAADIINSYVEPERTEVVEKAIALGADGAILRSLLVGSEVIEVVGTLPGRLPSSKFFPWWLVGAGGLGVIVLLLAIARRRKKA